jgi:hypothetical protein
VTRSVVVPRAQPTLYALGPYALSVVSRLSTGDETRATLRRRVVHVRERIACPGDKGGRATARRLPRARTGPLHARRSQRSSNYSSRRAYRNISNGSPQLWRVLEILGHLPIVGALTRAARHVRALAPGELAKLPESPCGSANIM